jgi:hypothetical protein
MSHRAPDPLTVSPDQVKLENDASWLVFGIFPMMFDRHQPQRLGLISLFSFSRSRTARSRPTSPVSLFSCFSPHPILFRPITESLDLASVPCSLNCGTRWLALSPMRRRVLILVRVGVQHDICRSF